MNACSIVEPSHATLARDLSALVVKKGWSEEWFGSTFAKDPGLFAKLRLGEDHSELLTTDLLILAETFRDAERAWKLAWDHTAQLDEELVLLRRHALDLQLPDDE